MANPSPRCGGMLAKSLFRWSALHTGGGVFLQRKSLGLYYDLNPDIFSITHNLAFPVYACLKIKLIFKEEPTLHVSLS